ncbi:MAG: ABC transporter ATP-binding protein [Ectothiorhodospiraceae bacterium]|nr:ABC transporter ATP-binding protein [Chromatiales bacterium]MCP5155477.1 ABC transporter ATP-binding protein [Ectothiorhodospiraceae bacterium]
MLRVTGLDAYYDESHVLQGVDLEVGRGELVALLGRNGAGKSTTLKAIMGIVPPRNGTIAVAGTDVCGQAPYRVARHGIGYVPEDRGMFASLTVEEHLAIVPRARHGEGDWTVDAIWQRFPRLRERRANRGNQLSGGEQQMLAIARALVRNPRLLVLDEPTEGLAPVVVREIAEVLADLKSHGLTVLLVEQNYPFATRLADRVYVLGKGRIRWHGTPAELERTPEVKHTWLGV